MALERATYTRPSHAEARARQAATSSKVVTVASKAAGVGLAGASVSADRGGSSKYSSENLED